MTLVLASLENLNMKVLVFCVALVASLVVGDPQQCESNDKCKADECCLMTGIFSKAFCHNLTAKGETCRDNELFRRGMYITKCPCGSGLSCQPTLNSRSK
ncbi:hypothetical protein CDAR_78791 [Caerostris darwini]|uniref:Uncharacterized protein n=1 Tax=Caerostris darwini TaxID=1538125 RepID=A0AAV4UX34_9ARAC|nr:hypothetical protein CDAR_78791 [Caerostris darwini]